MNAPAPAVGAGAPSAAPAPGAAPAPAAVPEAAPTHAVPHCENCGASIAGRYCGNCGQRVEPPVHSLWHFMVVAAEDVTHADSRLWSTLAALLFKPGFLTREFFDGRRARYLPPVRLYLVLSVAFFLWVSATGHTGMDADREAHLSPEAKAAIAKARQHGAIVIGPGAVGANAGDSAPTEAAPATTAPSATAPRTSFRGSATEGDEEHCKLIKYEGPWKATLQPLFVRSCQQTSEDHGRSLVQSFLHNLPRAMFLFLPLLAAVMMLLYWHPRHYYVEHLLFFVHNHAFAFLVLMLAGVAIALLPFAATLIGWLTALYLIWYVFRSMRVMYGQSRLRTFGKLAFMSFVYLLAGSLALAATAVYAFMTL
jgi:hypothetical protein